MSPTISADYLKVQTARANAALPAAGAWDATPTEMVCPGFWNFSLHFNYSRGAAAGAFDFQIQTSPWSRTADVPAGINEWEEQAIYASGAVAAGADTTSNIQAELISFTNTAAGDLSFIYGPVALDGAVERMRVRCRESGVVGTPGECYCLARFRDEEG